MSLPEFSYPTTAGPKYYNIAESQEKVLKTNYIKEIELLKEEMNKSFLKNSNKQLEEMKKSLKESQENTKSWRKLINSLQKTKNKQTNVEGKKMKLFRPENRNRSNENTS
jgi:ribosome-binding ATPase YchF (GTP1/OBG family)